MIKNDVIKIVKLANLYDTQGNHKKADKLDKTLIRLAQLGEFWLMNGQSLYADGDIGDVNHEGVVIDTILDQYNLDTMKMMDLEHKGLDDQNNRDYYLKELGMTDEELNAVRGLTDPREYGMSHFGWARVNGTDIQTYTINSTIMNDIANGLWDAYQEEAERFKYNIEIYASKAMYYDVPFDVISNANPSDLQDYSSTGIKHYTMLDA